MKNFGKIENGVFMEAPKSLKEDKFTYFNPKEELYIQHGYLPVVFSEFPADAKEKNFKQVFIEQGNVIVASWEEVKAEPKDTTLSRIEVLEAELKALKASLN